MNHAHPALQKILAKLNLPELPAQLGQLSVGELTTLLLEVYSRKTAALTPAQLLNNLPQNRFVQPTDLDPFVVEARELTALKLAQEAGFQPIELGPVAPLGSSSVYGKISQKTVLSALRGCEVVADPSTLMIPLMTSQLPKASESQLHWVASHRTLRTAFFESDATHFAHFQMLACCSVVRTQDKTLLPALVLRHFQMHAHILKQFGCSSIQLKFQRKHQQAWLAEPIYAALQTANLFDLELLNESGSDYYEGFQGKLFAEVGGERLELADGGFVSWPRELRGQAHLYGLISGLGLERLLRFSKPGE